MQGCSWWMAKCFLWLPTAPACTDFYPAFGMLVGVRHGGFYSDPCPPVAGTVGTARLSRTLMRRRCIIRMGKVGHSLGRTPAPWMGRDGLLLPDTAVVSRGKGFVSCLLLGTCLRRLEWVI